MENTREIACSIVSAVLEQGGQSHVVLRETLNRHPEMPGRDRHFVQYLVHGTVENLLLLDAKLNRVSKTPVNKMKPWIRTILRTGAYQILFMEKVPASAACNEAVKLAEKHHFHGLKGFVNGVLRAVARDPSLPEGDLALRYSTPAWLMERWQKTWGTEKTKAMMEAFLQPAKLSVRWNLSLASKDEIIQSLTGQKAALEPLPFGLPGCFLTEFERIDGLTAFQKGWIQVQDVSSILAGEAAAPKPGSRILDLCAAPGGKSLHLADLLRGTGEVIACDLTEKKTAIIEENLRRCGLLNLSVQVSDARVFRPEWEASFDLVMADLPCSGLGTIGHKPEIKYRVTPESIHSLSALQREILSAAVRYLKPGGTLVYSTCTVDAEENIDNFRWLLETFPLEPVPLTDVLPQGPEDESRKAGYIQLLPGTHPCDGFFISKCKRKDQ